MPLSSGNTLRRDISTKVDDEKEKVRQFFRPIEKVSLTVDTWTTTNHLAIIGITIHWIDYLWKLHEYFLAVKELCGSHGVAYMAKVLHEVLVDYNLTDKVKNVFNFCINFFTKYLFSLFCIAVRNHCS